MNPNDLTNHQASESRRRLLAMLYQGQQQDSLLTMQQNNNNNNNNALFDADELLKRLQGVDSSSSNMNFSLTNALAVQQQQQQDYHSSNRYNNNSIHQHQQGHAAHFPATSMSLGKKNAIARIEPVSLMSRMIPLHLFLTYTHSLCLFLSHDKTKQYTIYEITGSNNPMLTTASLLGQACLMDQSFTSAADQSHQHQQHQLSHHHHHAVLPPSQHMAERLAEENLILKRRLLMRQRHQSSTAAARSAHLNPLPLGVFDHAALQQLDQQQPLPAFPFNNNSSLSAAAASLPSAFNIGAGDHHHSMRGAAAATAAGDILAQRITDASTTAAMNNPLVSSDADTFLADQLSGHRGGGGQAAAGAPQLSPITTSANPDGGTIVTSLSNMTFPEKLYAMLDAAETEGYEDVIGFTPDDKYFRVHNRQRFVQEVMPRWFKTSHFASFHRQLNVYGFERVNKGSDRTAFHHPLFVRHAKHQLKLIRRKKQRVPAGEVRNTEDDRAAAYKALMGIQRNPVLLSNFRIPSAKPSMSAKEKKNKQY